MTAVDSPAEAQDQSRTFEDNGSMPIGSVEVLSQTAGGWMPGRIASPVHPDRTTITFEIDGRLLRKHRARSSSEFHLATYTRFTCSGDFNDTEAFDALGCRAFVRCMGGGLKCVTEELQFHFVRNNAFATRVPLQTSCDIEYHGPFDEDVILKVHTLDAANTQFDDYCRYMLEGYVHAMQKPRQAVHVEAGRYLGLSVHKNLNRDWLWRLSKEDYDQFVNRSGGDQGWSSVQCERFAEDADYLISLTSANRAQDECEYWKAAACRHRVKVGITSRNRSWNTASSLATPSSSHASSIRCTELLAALLISLFLSHGDACPRDKEQ
mmetsp:Transcript_79503/g.246619  ORF Transcript_79503/g.246619 Transcript_79503/m.246619 type:complete len:323 (-) Transcript_79503:33-1001(-)|eukprot:CAMPEP_0204589486 /NCGR_PEP_ID=MMETSP0661-20131031/49224_1 /ASSEMBLY_ACC=CAM_ASM_000606 /TAXON_ID=109239 /ORGANISM="Alexandrium margalefi, Strain AMGDE01CS-322" /LENGTH=322 /DNA_ID=CAMNT_0051599409 /DNA_START=65 /DNA_END=1033 /DNA_ORIENTATION=-